MDVEWDRDSDYLLTVGHEEVEIDAEGVQEIEKAFRLVNSSDSGTRFQFLAIHSDSGLRTWLFLPAGVPLVIKEVP